ncbi:hypothetical protein AGMMS49965_06350 [Bacteroidia bacterium]|nr:hypothetical protein AGMMS49965_06350 [Bacteroidia bacterium]
MAQLLDENFKLERYGLYVRFVEESDAEFILKLRTNPDLNRYIHQTPPDVEVQRQWIHNYKERQRAGKDFYFIFEEPQSVRLGVCRIYDITEENFTIGSWIFSPQAPIGSAILADIITREIAFELFPDKEHLFDVKRANTNVNRYHETFKSTLLFQDELTNYYTCSKENFEKYKNLHLRMFTKKKLNNYDKQRKV